MMMKSKLNGVTTLAALAVMLAGSSLVHTEVAAAEPPSFDEAGEIAVDAYIYAYPLVLMDATRSAVIGRAPMNQFSHAAVFPDATSTDVVRPNADALYSTLWFDVTREPLVIKVPMADRRYYLLPMLDMWSDVFASSGERTTGTGVQTFAIVGPSWSGTLPSGIEAIRSPTGMGWMIGRTQTIGKADYDTVHKFQEGLKATPLSGPAKASAPPKPTPEQSPSPIPPSEQVAAMDAVAFFTRFLELVKHNPPHANDYPILQRMRRIGIDPARPFNIMSATPDIRTAINGAPQAALPKITSLTTIGTVAKRWRLPRSPIGTYGTDYLRRAQIAYGGLGADVLEDVYAPTAVADADGKPFDSGQRYVMHFAKDQSPPVRGFWSLTMYNDKQLFADNPINRYAIRDRDAPRRNDDGSLDIYIQRASPGTDKESNWLPTPSDGGFSMTMRLYWPKPAALDGTWVPPPVKRVQ